MKISYQAGKPGGGKAETQGSSKGKALISWHPGDQAKSGAFPNRYPLNPWSLESWNPFSQLGEEPDIIYMETYI